MPNKKTTREKHERKVKSGRTDVRRHSMKVGSKATDNTKTEVKKADETADKDSRGRIITAAGEGALEGFLNEILYGEGSTKDRAKGGAKGAAKGGLAGATDQTMKEIDNI